MNFLEALLLQFRALLVRGAAYFGIENPETQNAVVKTVVLILVYLLVRSLLTPISRRFRSAPQRYRVRKIGGWTLTFAAGVYLAFIWVSEDAAERLLTALGILGAGLIIALREPILNLAGALYIFLRGPFHVRDRIQIGDGLKGDVVDIRLFMFSVLEVGNWVDAEQSTGRIVHVPNLVVFQQTVANYTQGFQFIWHEVPVTITFESNWEKAHRLLSDLAAQHSRTDVEEAKRQVEDTSTRFMVYYRRFTPIVWLRVVPHGVMLTLRYLCESRRRRSSESELWMHVLRLIRESDDIELAYPTQRWVDASREGKPLVHPLRADREAALDGSQGADAPVDSAEPDGAPGGVEGPGGDDPRVGG